MREISLSHLRDDVVEFKQAHSGAADYHRRHFKAKRIVAGQKKLGESFAELRYHLVQAGREAELSDIGQRFTNHLKREIKAGSPVPIEREELDERIGVLTVLLKTGGAMGLEYHLARCLQKRGKPDDIQKAVIHSKCATGSGVPVHSWLLFAQLTTQKSGVNAAIDVIYEALKAVPAKQTLSDIYQLGAKILGGAGRTDEAVELLKSGIKVIPPDKSLSSLYQICADLLAKAGRNDEAVSLLQSGIKVIPPNKGLISLYQICADLLSKAGADRRSCVAAPVRHKGHPARPKPFFSLPDMRGP